MGHESEQKKGCRNRQNEILKINRQKIKEWL